MSSEAIQEMSSEILYLMKENLKEFQPLLLEDNSLASSQPYLLLIPVRPFPSCVSIYRPCFLGTGMLGTRRKGFLMIVTLDREGREVSYDPQIFEFLTW